MSDLMGEARARVGEGYSARQLIGSHIPEIGGDIVVKESEVIEVVVVKNAKAATCQPTLRGMANERL